jgi:serine/threonine protein phosphatase PrpC
MTSSTARITINAFGLTDVGRVRKNNQDSFFFTQLGSGLENVIEPNTTDDHARWIFIVADGMGGGQAGEVASQMTVELVTKNFAEPLTKKKAFDHNGFVRALIHAVETTNQTVFQESQSKEELHGMGTTVTAAAVAGSTLTVAQLGDSRAYLLRDDTITQLTKDQSLVAQMVAAGKITPEEAKTHPRRNVILQALGVQARVDVAIVKTDLRRNDRLILCSDGLWGKVEAEEIKEFTDRYEPQAACENLVRLANERGGEDNVTVIVASFSGDGLPLSQGRDIAPPDTAKRRRRWWWLWLR